ncbi:hypothetical protein Cgig2_017225 [Carnegiea gigantea]|uniref:Uncharacterized protein n=1 Tax=Carnegiea gigantea TaxID=171969 RepID=A0A9Q1QIA5_9CARY|nr:hypothetical protein Cgig2_017225 [Carnegiea gigantea]
MMTSNAANLTKTLELSYDSQSDEYLRAEKNCEGSITNDELLIQLKDGEVVGTMAGRMDIDDSKSTLPQGEEAQNGKALVVVLVGAPGSGKSTFCENVMQASSRPWVRICQVADLASFTTTFSSKPNGLCAPGGVGLYVLNSGEPFPPLVGVLLSHFHPVLVRTSL